MVKGGVCKTPIQRFDPARRLHFPLCLHPEGRSLPACFSLEPFDCRSETVEPRRVAIDQRRGYGPNYQVSFVPGRIDCVGIG